MMTMWRVIKALPTQTSPFTRFRLLFPEAFDEICRRYKLKSFTLRPLVLRTFN